jgi:pSer/pThr/pTyr-binding forkhead associated (FHA) protein
VRAEPFDGRQTGRFQIDRSGVDDPTERSWPAVTGEPPPGNPVVARTAPHLTLVAGAGADRERAIPCRRVVTLIGSRPGCKINLQHRSVDPVHTALVNNGSRVIAVDLVTDVGTLLNGLRMEHEPLDDGDLLTIRTWEFRVDIREPEITGPGDAHPFGLDPSPHVVALEDIASGRLMKPGRDVCVIGRRNGCDIAISDDCVSRTHALVFNYFGHPAVFDLLSSNHTLVNDRAVEFCQIKDGDIVGVGESQFRVHVRGSAITEKAARDAQSGNHKADAPPPDQIDIHATESVNRWGIVDNYEKANRKR